MARRHWALVLMGAWMMGTICVSIVAAENFYTIDRLLAARDSSGFASFVDRLGVAPARELLRYLSSELNRLYFQLWNLSQIVLGAVVWGLVRRLDRTASRGVLAMLVVVVLLLAWLTPAIVTLGRSLDFVPRDPLPSGMQRFWILHTVYTSLELLKLAVGFFVTWRLTPIRA